MMRRGSVPLVLLLGALLAGCGNEPPPADSAGRTPGDVAVLAFQAAIRGDYDEANQYGTAKFVEREQEARQRLEAGEEMLTLPA